MAELQLKFMQIAPDAKRQITNITRTAIKPWARISDLQLDRVDYPPNSMTNEWGFTVLDGSRIEFPNNTASHTWGFWSNNMSRANCTFASNPAIEISFAEGQKSAGVTLHFYPGVQQDHARNVQVTWFDASNTIMHSGTYELFSNIGSVAEAIDGFWRVRIEFLDTTHPHRYIKLYAIDIGLIRIFLDEEISTCRILEEVDPTVESISVNTLNATIRTRNSIFSPVTSPDFDNMMMARQHMEVSRNNEPFGTFFLKNWVDPHQAGIEFKLKAEDAMALFDLYPFDGGIYENTLITTILDTIFNIVFPTQLVVYNLHESLRNRRVSGWIPADTCGYAFQLIMFAINGIADTSRHNSIEIYPTAEDISYTMDLTEQYLGGKDKLAEYFSGVDVYSYRYSRGTVEIQELFNDTLTVGQHQINFRTPQHGLAVTGATFVRQHPNFAIVNVTTSGNVRITGREYIESQQVHSVRSSVAAGEINAIKKFENYTLVSPNIGQWLAEQQYAHLQKRIESENDVVLGDRTVGRLVHLGTRGKWVDGLITRLNINLRGGRASMTTFGNVSENQIVRKLNIFNRPPVQHGAEYVLLSNAPLRSNDVLMG